VTHRDMAADIDDLSRDLTEEIEAHRLTRERAEKAEAERDKWEHRNSEHAAKYLAVLRERDTLADRISDLRGEIEEAEARLAELVREVWEWSLGDSPRDTQPLLDILAKYEGGEHG